MQVLETIECHNKDRTMPTPKRQIPNPLDTALGAAAAGFGAPFLSALSRTTLPACSDRRPSEAVLTFAEHPSQIASSCPIAVQLVIN